MALHVEVHTQDPTSFLYLAERIASKILAMPGEPVSHDAVASVHFCTQERTWKSYQCEQMLRQ
jgi:hypothetical protein